MGEKDGMSTLYKIRGPRERKVIMNTWWRAQKNDWGALT